MKEEKLPSVAAKKEDYSMKAAIRNFRVPKLHPGRDGKMYTGIIFRTGDGKNSGKNYKPLKIILVFTDQPIHLRCISTS